MDRRRNPLFRQLVIQVAAARYSSETCLPLMYHESMKHYVFPIVIEHDEDGYAADCPALQGCHAQGETYEVTLANIKDAVELHIQDRVACGEVIEPPAALSITLLDVSA